MGDRPPGERARGDDGRAGMSTGERGSATEKREKLRERGTRRVLKSNFDCARPVGRTARRLVRKARGTSWEIVRRGREHAARAARRACTRGVRADEGPGDACALQREKLRERGAELVFR